MVLDKNLIFERTYPYVVLPDSIDNQTNCFVAYHPDLPGCMSHGDTIDHAIEALMDARREYLSALIEAGQPIPEPSEIHSVLTTGISSDEIFAMSGSTEKYEEVEMQSTLPMIPVERMQEA